MKRKKIFVIKLKLIWEILKKTWLKISTIDIGLLEITDNLRGPNNIIIVAFLFSKWISRLFKSYIYYYQGLNTELYWSLITLSGQNLIRPLLCPDCFNLPKLLLVPKQITDVYFLEALAESYAKCFLYFT